MAKESESPGSWAQGAQGADGPSQSRGRPVTVSELIARASDADSAFPRSSSVSVQRDDEPPEPKPERRVVGASGMPTHSAPVSDADPNVVTGIIPVVNDDVRPVDGDDLLGYHLPPAEIRTSSAADELDFFADTTPPAAAEPAAAEPAVVDPKPEAPDSTESTTVIPPVPEPMSEADLPYTAAFAAVPAAAAASAADEPAVEPEQAEPAFSDSDEESGDHLASAGELDDAEREESEHLAAETDDATADADEKKRKSGRSPIWEWLRFAAEVIVGLAVGAGLFWGFTELWKRYIYLALVLAVLVIFAIVTFAHVLRKRDLPTTLLSLGVGMLVTIGPLVLLAA